MENNGIVRKKRASFCALRSILSFHLSNVQMFYSCSPPRLSLPLSFSLPLVLSFLFYCLSFIFLSLLFFTLIACSSLSPSLSLSLSLYICLSFPLSLSHLSSYLCSPPLGSRIPPFLLHSLILYQFKLLIYQTKGKYLFIFAQGTIFAKRWPPHQGINVW